jgi:hypothetical protein
MSKPMLMPTSGTEGQGRRAAGITPGALLATLALLVAVLALAASPALAEVYHVKLKNGTSIDTAYKPQQASWDAGLVLLLTDSGNWVGLPQKEVDSVQTESQIHGFGVALNFDTVAIGWAPNDFPEPTEANAQSATLQMLQSIYQQQQSQSHYSIPQFVNTDQSQGIPARFVGYTGSPGVSVPPVLPPTPTPAPPASTTPPPPAHQ